MGWDGRNYRSTLFDSCLMAYGNRSVGHRPVSVGSCVNTSQLMLIVALIGSLSRMAGDGGNLGG